MTTITWNISQLDCHPKKDGNTDVVFTVHWQCNGMDGDYAASVYSTCSLPAPSSPFTPYDDLTRAQVFGWIWDNGVDKAATEAAVEQQVAAQKNPPVVSPPLPWVTP